MGNGELERGLRTEFFKILDLHRSNYIMPTESGMPVYLTLKTPTVTQMKGEIKLSGKHTEQPGGEFSTVVVSNIKKLLHSGVKSELTKRFYGVGVETSMHVAVPVKGEVSYRKGQVQVTLKQTKETGFQREHSVLEFDVHPFTTSQSLSDFEVMSKGRNVKTIRTRESELKKEVNVGKPIGLDLKLKLETEEVPLNTYSTLEYLRMDGVSGSILSLINTIKRTKLQLLFSPSTSETKELDLHLNVGYGLMKNQQKQATIRILDEEVKERIERACQEFAPESVEKCKSEMYEWEKKQDSEVVQFCKEEETYRAQWMKQQLKQHLQEECLSERHLCKVEKKWCIEKEEKDGLSRVESTRSCEKKLLFCTMKSQSRSILKTAIGKIETGSAVSVSLAAILRSSERSQDKKIETHIALSQKNSSLSETETHVTGRVTIETPMLRKPYHVEIEANTILKKPTSMWNREELMREDLTSRLMFIGQYGLRGEEKKTIKSTLRVLKSDEHKKYIRQSPEYEQCIKDESEGRLLTESCEELRTLVTSLDKIEGKLYLPIEIAQNKIVERTSEAVKLMLLPYLTEKNMESRISGQHMEYEIESRINGTGKLLCAMVAGNGKKVEVHDIRLGNTVTEILPISTKYSLSTSILQKLTNYTTPSTCTLESGKVHTFDKMNYTYSLNDCEHVVFTELSTEPRVLITTRKTPQKQHIKMIVDGHKYEVEINKESRYSRGSKGMVKIDERTRELENVLENFNTMITKYVDGVYSIYSRKYGVEIIADGERLIVRSNPLVFRDRATGLCGDFNGEWVADLQSPKQCVIPVPKLSAMTFMLQDGKCKGVPQHIKPELEKYEQKCLKKEVIPTRVGKVFKSHVTLRMRYETELKHTFEQFGEKLCFSKELIRVCSRGYPKQVTSHKVPFTCLSGPYAEVIKSRIIAGERVEELSSHPTEFTQTVYEAKKC